MSCAEIREKLSLYLEGDLPDAERAEIDGHLPACAACAETMSLLREVSTGLRRMEEVEPPPHLARKIQGAIAEKARSKHSRPAWWESWAPALAAAAVVLLTIGTVMYIDRTSLQEEQILPRLEIPAEAPAPAAPPSPPSVEPEKVTPSVPAQEKAKPAPKSHDAISPLRDAKLREEPVGMLAPLKKEESPIRQAAPAAERERKKDLAMEKSKVSETGRKDVSPLSTAERKAARPPDAVITLSDPKLAEKAQSVVLAQGGKALKPEPQKAPAELRALVKEYRLEGQEAPVLEYSIPRARYPDLIQRLRELDPKLTAPSLEADTRDAGQETLTIRLEVRKPPSP